MTVIRPCRFEECPAVLALWERAGAIPSPTDTLEELTRVWTALQESYQLSVAYCVQVALINSEREPERVAPVVLRESRGECPFAFGGIGETF